jgi:hypothetical protein
MNATFRILDAEVGTALLLFWQEGSRQNVTLVKRLANLAKIQQVPKDELMLT